MNWTSGSWTVGWPPSLGLEGSQTVERSGTRLIIGFIFQYCCWHLSPLGPFTFFSLCFLISRSCFLTFGHPDAPVSFSCVPTFQIFVMLLLWSKHLHSCICHILDIVFSSLLQSVFSLKVMYRGLLLFLFMFFDLLLLKRRRLLPGLLGHTVHLFKLTSISCPADVVQPALQHKHPWSSSAPSFSYNSD